MYNIQYVDNIQWVIYFIRDIYKEHITTESVERAEYFRKFALFTEYFFKFLVLMYFSLIFVVLTYPGFMYFTQHELVPIMPLYIPGIDENTIIGYIIITIYHLTMITLASVGIAATDFFLAIVIISSLIFAKLIWLEMQQIHTDLDEKSSELSLKVHFRNILRMHKEMCE